jgi:hypothetical protein
LGLPTLQVRILEKEKEVVTSQFDRRRHELEHLLAATRAELDAVRADRDSWKARAEGSEVREGKGGVLSEVHQTPHLPTTIRLIIIS